MVDAGLREINLRIDSFFGILILDLSLEIWKKKNWMIGKIFTFDSGFLKNWEILNREIVYRDFY